MQEAHYLEIDGVMLYLEEARRRTERAAGALRAGNAEPHLVEALDPADVGAEFELKVPSVAGTTP